MPSTLDLDRPRDGVVILRLNRPERLNAINAVMQTELIQVLDDLADDGSARAVVLTGTGRGFCAGIDMRDFGPGMLEATAPALDRMRFQERMAALAAGSSARCPSPVIAAVNGPCVGAGFALCLASDIRICSTAASFGNAAILLGLSGAEMGMSYHLPRIVGTSVAADWMLTGRTVSAAEADRRGLISELVEPDRLTGRALELASLIADLSPLGVQLTKRALQVNTDAAESLLGAGIGEPQSGDLARHRGSGRAPAEVVEVSGPLSGVRIVMMGGLGPAPFCGMLLGDLGADVVRVDPVAGVDGPLPIDYTVRRSQRSLAADVKDPRGRDLVHRLVADVDAFVDVYRPGVAERLGIGPDALQSRIRVWCTPA